MKSATEAFIEDAIAGGYQLPNHWEELQLGRVIGFGDGSKDRCIPITVILFDPLAWQAAGKTRVWMDAQPKSMAATLYGREGWKHEWHRFIDHLADGLSIEEALGKISQ